MFAQGWLDLGLSGGLYVVVKIVACIAGAVIGWFVSDPLTRLAYRIIRRAPTPGWLLPWTKLAGAATLAATVWFFMPQQEGNGGGGGGNGLFGLFGTGNKNHGDGNAKTTVSVPSKETKSVAEDKKTTSQHRMVKIELVPDKLKTKDGKKHYFLVDNTEPAKTIEEVRDYLVQNPKIRVNIISTLETPVGKNSITDPKQQLLHVVNELKIEHLETNTNQ